ncbi:MAG: MOSC domain-containing protein [Helicobacter sp.]|uniref:MOSC domain-containing protein n=1 Tax=Helicobacter sp. TaxID=218 RepID=UPI0023CA2833|nr:MOSC domain-containing protein [Helicobacter sp.]MDE5926751.1 MOSC domain-containing protein [Helicobacter sp.]MDE7174909.1 MOSC domain-containing protein [Helicobacter sp.]
MRLRGLFVGKIARYSCGEVSFESAMKGREVESLDITSKGIVGNEIADTIHHGGENKAVFAYDVESYTKWHKCLGLEIPYGGMGENLLLEEIEAGDLCVGDRLCFESGVVLEISMPRVQCFKIPSLYPSPQDKNALAKFLFETGCVGFYLRVIQGGRIQKDSAICLESAQDSITLRCAHQVYKNPKLAKESLHALLINPKLAQEFKRNVESRSNESGLLDWQLA